VAADAGGVGSCVKCLRTGVVEVSLSSFPLLLQLLSKAESVSWVNEGNLDLPPALVLYPETESRSRQVMVYIPSLPPCSCL